MGEVSNSQVAADFAPEFSHETLHLGCYLVIELVSYESL